MLSRRSWTLLLAALVVSATAFQARAQAVISTHAGVVHYFEGAVYLNDQPLEPRLGRFLSMPEGAELRTEEGRAEVLLTPGVFLRIDRNSAIRMVSSSLADSRVELLSGSAMVDSAEPAPGTSVSLMYRNWQVRFPQKGVYRIDAGQINSAGVDSGKGCVWVREGQAEVTDAATGEPIAVQPGMDLPLAAALVPEQSFSAPSDSLSNWSRGRADSISADNQIAASIQDPASMTDPNLAFGDPAQYGFTQFPLLGLSPIGPVTPGVYNPYVAGMYTSAYPYQPGFFALYLPGYTYRPLFLPSPSSVRSPRSPTVYTPLPRTVYTITTPRSISAPSTVARPAAPIVRPAPAAHPVVVAPHVVAHPH